MTSPGAARRPWSFADILRDAGVEELEEAIEETNAQQRALPVETDTRAVDAAIARVREFTGRTGSLTQGVPFQLAHEADSVPDVGSFLSEMPSHVIDDLAANQPRAFLTEPPETTDARTSLRLFENHTRHLRGTRSTHWLDELAPWAGTCVVQCEPENAESAPLTLAWRAADNARRNYSLVVFEQSALFYVATVLCSDDGARELTYKGAFYMQSVRSHEVDLEVQ
jgi:hypothetical protein